jgi:hypothetical protein
MWRSQVGPACEQGDFVKGYYYCCTKSIMGKTYSHFIKRPVKNWNVEDRAFKQLDKIEKKATQAPRHPSSKKYIDNIAKGTNGLVNTPIT